MRYGPRNEVAQKEELDDWIKDISIWAHGEFQQIEQAFNEQDAVFLRELNVAPTNPRKGMTVLADGTNWDPGSGAGVYTYYGAAWHKLG